MILLYPGKWNHKADRLFIYDRILKSKYKYTPFVKVRFRYLDIPTIIDCDIDDR